MISDVTLMMVLRNCIPSGEILGCNGQIQNSAIKVLAQYKLLNKTHWQKTVLIYCFLWKSNNFTNKTIYFFFCFVFPTLLPLQSSFMASRVKLLEPQSHKGSKEMSNQFLILPEKLNPWMIEYTSVIGKIFFTIFSRNGQHNIVLTKHG